MPILENTSQLIENTSKLMEIVKNVAQTLAWLIGGWWILRNYHRDRTHVSRLQVGLDTNVVRMEDRYRLNVTITVNNPGRSKAIITHQSSRLLVFRLKNIDTPVNASADVTIAEAPEWKVVGLFGLFGDGRADWETKEIEPGITLKEEVVVLLPVKRELYLIRLMLRSLDPSGLTYWQRPLLQRISQQFLIRRIWNSPFVKHLRDRHSVQRIWKGTPVKAVPRVNPQPGVETPVQSPPIVTTAAEVDNQPEATKFWTWSGIHNLGSRDDTRRRWSTTKVIEINPNAEINPNTRNFACLLQELQSCKINSLTSPPIL